MTLTEPLRRAAVTGTQVHFTYDQHWTPEGHQVVAEAVHGFLESVTLSRDIQPHHR